MVVKIILVGNGFVGKSTIRERFLGISFRPAYLQTVGADYTMKEQVLEHNSSITLQIWDLAGQQGFSNIRESFYKGTDGALLIFDVSKPETAESIRIWIRELRKNIKTKVPLILVGNKIDLRTSDNQSISYEQGVKLAKKLSQSFKTNIQYIESSAKTGENIDLIFSTIAVSVITMRNLFQRITKNKLDFDRYFNEYAEYVHLYFFKMHDDGPYCSAKTNEIGVSEELLTKMAIYYATSLGQGAIEHTGLFGPFPLPITQEEEKEKEEEEENQMKMTEQSIIYSFKKLDPTLTDVRAKGISFCFIVITIPEDFVNQLNTNSLKRFFYDRLEPIENVTIISDEFLADLKKDLLNDVFLLNS